MSYNDLNRFCEENQVALLVLFGSSAMGPERSRDVDVAVRLKPGVAISKLELIYQLDAIFKGKPVDLVVLTKDTDPLLLHEIFSKGRLLYEEAQGIFEKEKLRAWKLYIDTEPLRKRQRKYLEEFIGKTSMRR